MKKTYIRPSAEIVRLNLKHSVNDYEGGIDEGQFGFGSGNSSNNGIDSGDLNGKEIGFEDEDTSSNSMSDMSIWNAWNGQ